MTDYYMPKPKHTFGKIVLGLGALLFANLGALALLQRPPRSSK